MDAQEASARAEILHVINSWGFWRDDHDWAALLGAYAPDGRMVTSWSNLSAADFVQACRNGMNQSAYAVQHMTGGSLIKLRAARAVAETRSTLLLRGLLDGIEVDVTSYGRTYDRFVKLDTGWKILQRNGVYEKSRIDLVDPSAVLHLDPTILDRYPAAYRYLAYFQAAHGAKVPNDLAVPGNEVMRGLRAAAEAWLDGAA